MSISDLTVEEFEELYIIIINLRNIRVAREVLIDVMSDDKQYRQVMNLLNKLMNKYEVKLRVLRGDDGEE